MMRKWMVREQPATCSAVTVVVALGIACSAMALPLDPPGVSYTAGGHTTTLYSKDGVAAIAYPPGASVSEAAARLEADTVKAEWEVLRSMPDYSMAIVKTTPAKAISQANRLGIPLANAYPVFYQRNAPDLPIIATEEIYVQFKDGVSDADRRKLLDQYSLQFIKVGPGGAWKAFAPVFGADVMALTAAIGTDSRVRWCEPNFLVGIRLHMAPSLPNDPFLGNQWHIENTLYNTNSLLGIVNSDCDIPRFWNQPLFGEEAKKPDRRLGEGIVVAVLDTGVDLTHEDLKDNLVLGWDFVDEDQSPIPDQCMFNSCSHGTAVAGIIAAKYNNGIGVSGIAPKAKIMPIRIFLATDQASSVVSQDRIAAAVRFAVDQDADVMNNSWGGGLFSSQIKDAFDYGVASGRGGKGIVSLASSGNEYTNLSYPAAYESVISVGAVSDQDLRVSYSNAGPNLDIVAPSQDFNAYATVDFIDFEEDPPVVVRREFAITENKDRTGIWTTDMTGIYGSNSGSVSDGDSLGNYYNSFNGTSASCPVAVGCVALLMAMRPQWTVAELRDAITKYADLVGDYSAYIDPENPWIPGETDFCTPMVRSLDLGYGRINPYRALYGIKKPFPMRNVQTFYETDWGMGTDNDGWTTETKGLLPIDVATEELPDKSFAEDSLDRWVLTPSGWEETPRYEYEEDALPDLPTDLEDDYLFQDFLMNPKGHYPPGAFHGLVSPTIDIPTTATQQFATLVLTHRFSLEILGNVTLPTGGSAFEMDSGQVEVKLGDGPWRVVKRIRGTSAANNDYEYEDDTVSITQSIPLGQVGGLGTFQDERLNSAQFRFWFLSNSLHNPNVGFGWTIHKAKLVLYDIGDEDYGVGVTGGSDTPELTSVVKGLTPDWASDSRSIYFMSPDKSGILVADSQPQPRWADGTLCLLPFGANYLGSPESLPMGGLDFHPITDRLVTCYDNTTAGSQGFVAIQSMNSDITDGQAVTVGMTVAARDIRYSSDGTWVVFTDGLSSIYLAVADGGMENPIRIGDNQNPLIYYPPDGGTPQQLVNIGHPVFCFKDQRVIFEAGTVEKPTQTKLYILHRATRLVERQILPYWNSGDDSWKETTEKMAEVGLKSTRLLFVSNASDANGTAGTSDTLYLINNLESVALGGTPPEIYQIDPTLPAGYVGPRMFSSPRYSPDYTKIVYTLDGSVRIRKFPPAYIIPPPPPPSSVPTPTPPPTPALTPTPVATPVEETVTFDGQILFSVGGLGWNLTGTSVYSTPTLTLTPDDPLTPGDSGGHTLRSYNNSNTFGYLASPQSSASVTFTEGADPNNPDPTLTLIRWWVSGSLTPGFSPNSPLSLPNFRLRATSVDNQDTQMVVVETLEGGSRLPSFDKANPTAYDLILSPAPGIDLRTNPQERFNLGFDLLNFKNSDDPHGALTLHKIEFYRIPGSAIQETTVPATEFGFSPDNQGWTVGPPPDEQPPSWVTPDAFNVFGSLALASPNNNTTTYGYWARDNAAVGASTSANRLWKFQWSVFTFDTDPVRVPSFRLRGGTTDSQMATLRHISSEADGDLTPVKLNRPDGRYSQGRTYTTFLRPITAETGDQAELPTLVNLGFDLLNFNPKDNPTGMVALDNLKISVVEISDYPDLP